MRNSAKLSLLSVTVAALALTGCDKPKARTPKAPAASAASPAGPALPALPEWSGDMIGKAQAALFPGELKPCVGNTDNVEQQFADGVKIVGWGWDPATKAPIARVILVDVTGLVAGVGETGLARPDVPAAKPEITSPTTGWAGLTSRKTGPIDAYGIIDGGKSLCRLGHLEF
jgi:hypothetical protein